MMQYSNLLTVVMALALSSIFTPAAAWGRYYFCSWRIYQTGYDLDVRLDYADEIPHGDVMALLESAKSNLKSYHKQDSDVQVPYHCWTYRHQGLIFLINAGNETPPDLTWNDVLFATRHLLRSLQIWNLERAPFAQFKFNVSRLGAPEDTKSVGEVRRVPAARLTRVMRGRNGLSS